MQANGSFYLSHVELASADVPSGTDEEASGSSVVKQRALLRRCLEPVPESVHHHFP